jgi:hypothetical protein
VPGTWQVPGTWLVIMIVYVDMEHDRMRARPRRWERTLAVRLRDKFRLEEISGEPCLIVRYKQVTPAMLDELGVRAVVVRVWPGWRRFTRMPAGRCWAYAPATR